MTLDYCFKNKQPYLHTALLLINESEELAEIIMLLTCFINMRIETLMAILLPPWPHLLIAFYSTYTH